VKAAERVAHDRDATAAAAHHDGAGAEQQLDAAQLEHAQRRR